MARPLQSPARAASAGASRPARAAARKLARPPDATPTADPRRDAGRDSFDFRDLVYRPALVELPPRQEPHWDSVHILDQGQQGACTGFGLAATINYLNARAAPPDRRARVLASPRSRVSARMLFEMAKNFDAWPGRAYDYSNTRGAMKGWFKHGVCPEADWPYVAVDVGTLHAALADARRTADRAEAKRLSAAIARAEAKIGVLTEARQNAALANVLGAYYRVMPRRTDLHAALAEVGVVFASAATHAGWDDPQAGVIAWSPEVPEAGGHAFAIVGWTERGFLVQNSWGDAWGGWDGHAGIALWTYADFDQNAWDLWVARKARPVESLAALRGTKYTVGPTGTRVSRSGPPAQQIWNHYVHLDEGGFDARGDYPSSAAETRAIAARLVAGTVPGLVAPPKHLLLWAHGGLVSVGDATRQIATLAPVFLANGIAPLCFVWETGILETLSDLIVARKPKVDQRVAAASSWTDTMIERFTQGVGGAIWADILRDADASFAPGAGGSTALDAIAGALRQAGAAAPALHFVGHSAGAVFGCHLLDRWRALRAPAFASATLMAPACTVERFDTTLRPRLEDRTVARLDHLYLDDAHEQGDRVALIYGKSVLYLVANAYQDRRRETPILGMEKYWNAYAAALPASLRARVAAFNTRDDPAVVGSKRHTDFDNDANGLNFVMRRVLGVASNADLARPFVARDFGR
ncbi:MAG: C1 family peptidase [Burkholderiales bacterium]|jgi:hypothetical protein|nr:C1 family peptidase [Burkholderiales bacterium]